jgi:hypothetical protein
MRRSRIALGFVGISLFALVIASGLAGCGDGGAASTPAASTSTTSAGVSPTALAGQCQPAWQGWPDTSPSILGGSVLLPPSTRVILVDSAPGEADANLCTLGMSAAQIDQFMKAHLPANGWRYDAGIGQWRNGDVLTFAYSVPNPLTWMVECRCGGI